MPLRSKISMDACVQIDGDCPLTCQVIGDQTELVFGTDALSLVLEEQALERLVAVAGEALVRLQATSEGIEVEFRVSELPGR